MMRLVMAVLLAHRRRPAQPVAEMRRQFRDGAVDGHLRLPLFPAGIS
jgi:hypothetical protein